MPSRPSCGACCGAIEAARADGLDISVTGMDEFDIADFSTELTDAQELLALGREFANTQKKFSNGSRSST